MYFKTRFELDIQKRKQLLGKQGYKLKIQFKMFASCSEPSKSLSRSRKNTTWSAKLPQSQSPFSTCANKFDFGRTMCTFPRQAECVWNTLVHAVLLSERQWGQDKLKMTLICLLCSRQGFNSFRASAGRGQDWKSHPGNSSTYGFT